jgi:hypothetical protein
VHPSVDPSRKFDGSFISLNKILEYIEIKKLILTIHIPSNGTIS